MPKDEKGQVGLGLILILVIVLSYFLVGGLFSSKPTSNSNLPTASTSTAGGCCDNGECNPTTTGKKFDFTLPNGQSTEYGLLRSNVTLREFNAHLSDTTKTTPSTLYSDGKEYPIVRNTSDGFYDFLRLNFPQYAAGECSRDGRDQVWGNDNPADPNACVPIPNDALIYVCKDKCTPDDRSYHVCADPRIPCYGQRDAVYDVYYNITQYHADSDKVPEVISKCSNTAAASTIKKQVLTFPSPQVGKQLQLQTFKVENVQLQSAGAGWISPYCKPAIYLYPQQKTDIRVALAPKGELNLTIPSYPLSGWNVTAYPDGKIDYLASSYDYLYYEAQIPDQLIEVPKEGYVIQYSDIKLKLDMLLPKLGLNSKETSQFSDYWVKALPKNPYYFVGIISTDNLNSISPLTIKPTPDNLIRVTLYFEPLDLPTSVEAPIINPVIRDGFTVVEWGGIYKTDPNHPFSCLM